MPVQPGPRPMQSRLHCSHWHSQDSCNLLRGQFLHVKHVENLGMVRSYSTQRLGKKDTSLFERALLLGIRTRFHYFESGSSITFNHLVERCFGPSATQTQSHERRV